MCSFFLCHKIREGSVAENFEFYLLLNAQSLGDMNPINLCVVVHMRIGLRCEWRGEQCACDVNFIRARSGFEKHGAAAVGAEAALAHVDFSLCVVLCMGCGGAKPFELLF